jgi:hypothetical protein
MTAIGAALAIGYAQRQGWQIPQVAGLSPSATAGLAAWAYGRWGKSQTAQHLATGLLSVAAYSWAATSGVQGVMGDDVMGSAVAYEDDMEP